MVYASLKNTCCLLFVGCLLQSYLANGTAVSDVHGFVTTPDSTFCFSRIKPSCFDPDEDIPVFVPGLTTATSVANAVSEDAARELMETLSKLSEQAPPGPGTTAPASNEHTCEE